MIDLRQAFQRGAGLHQYALAEQAARRGDLDGGNRQAQGAGTGDDQDGDRAQQGRTHVQPADQPPAQEGRGGDGVDHRHIDGRGPVGQADIAALGLGAGLHQPCDFRQGGVFGAGRRAHHQPAGEVQRPGRDRRAGAGALGRRLAGHQHHVQVRATLGDHAVHRRALARAHHDKVPDRDIAHRNAVLGPIGAKARGDRRLQREQIPRGASRLGPQLVVEIAADQQQEEQGDCGVEIGVRPAPQGLRKADRQGQEHADRDRHVHVGLAASQRAPGGLEERHAGVEGAGRGHQRAQPVHQGPSADAHLLAEQPGPGRHREHHHIADAETGDAQGEGEPPAFAILQGPRFRGIKGGRRIAEVLQGGDHVGGPEAAHAPARREPAGREVQAGLGDARQGAHGRLDLAQAGGAARAFDQELDFLLALAARTDEGGEVRGRGADDGVGQRHSSRRWASKAWPPRSDADSVRSHAPGVSGTMAS